MKKVLNFMVLFSILNIGIVYKVYGVTPVQLYIVDPQNNPITSGVAPSFQFGEWLINGTGGSSNSINITTSDGEPIKLISLSDGFAQNNITANEVFLIKIATQYQTNATCGFSKEDNNWQGCTAGRSTISLKNIEKANKPPKGFAEKTYDKSGIRTFYIQ
ncbi:MAG: hypothetical protein WD068_02565 [Candidatus Babeliales bacterium]